MISDKTKRQLATTALFQAEKIRQKYSQSITVPVDLVDIASKTGCEVMYAGIDSLEGIYSPTPRPAIIIGSRRPLGRRNFTCAHELGHHIFKHGEKMEAAFEHKQTGDHYSSPEEFLADSFAGFLLMPKMVVTSSLKARKYSPANLTPLQTYRVASYLGVGYTTFLFHLRFILRENIPNYAQLSEASPKEIKAQFGVIADSECIFADHFWLGRPLDMQVGDHVIFPHDVMLESNDKLRQVGRIANENSYIALAPGYARATCGNNWAINIRISRHGYEGLARYRFLEDEEQEAANDCP